MAVATAPVVGATPRVTRLYNRLMETSHAYRPLWGNDLTVLDRPEAEKLPLIVRKAMAVEMVILRWISSSSKSVIVLPSSTRSSRLEAPTVKSNPAVSVVLPESPWPTTPMFRMSLLS